MCQKDVGNQSDKQGREVACCLLEIIKQWPLLLEFSAVIAAVIISRNKQMGRGKKRESGGRFLIMLELLFLCCAMMCAWEERRAVDRYKYSLYCLSVSLRRRKGHKVMPISALWHFSLLGSTSFPFLPPREYK